jgi:hypothetical protein
MGEVPDRAPRLRLWFVVAVAVSAVASGAGVYAYQYYTTRVTVSGINWEVFINGSSRGYVFDGGHSGCVAAGNCPNNATTGTLWIDVLSFPYGPTEYNLAIRNVTTSTPFTVVWVSPSQPVLVAQFSDSIDLHIAIQLPSSAGTYSPLGEIWISS